MPKINKKPYPHCDPGPIVYPGHYRSMGTRVRVDIFLDILKYWSLFVFQSSNTLQILWSFQTKSSISEQNQNKKRSHWVVANNCLVFLVFLPPHIPDLRCFTEVTQSCSTTCRQRQPYIITYLISRLTSQWSLYCWTLWPFSWDSFLTVNKHFFFRFDLFANGFSLRNHLHSCGPKKRTKMVMLE